MKNIAKILCFVLALAAVFTIIGVTAFAEEGTSVAKIGDDEYATLAEAAAAAKEGDTIVLLSDVTLSESVTLPTGIIFDGNGKSIAGTIVSSETITFAGHTKVTSFNASYYNHVVNIVEGACLEVTGTGRVTFGWGNTFNIVGSIENAKTADKTQVQPSLIVPAGVSITGTGFILNVTDAYISLGSTTTKNSAATDEFNFNFTNSIVEFTNQFTFAEPTNGKTPTYTLNIKDCAMTTGTKFIIAAPNTTVVVDNSDITLATYFRNSGDFTLQNESSLTGSMIQFGENGGNDGNIVVDNSSLTINCSAAGHAMDGNGTGTLTLKNGAVADVDYIQESAIEIEANSSFTAQTLLTDTTVAIDVSKASSSTQVLNIANGVADGVVTLTNTDDAVVETDANGNITVVAYVAKIGDAKYTSLADALKAVNATNNVVDILADVTIDGDWTRSGTGSYITNSVTINGNDHVITFTGAIKDPNYLAAFRFEGKNTVINDLTIDLSKATGYWCAITTKYSLELDGCTIIGNDTAKRGVLYGERADADIGSVTVSVNECSFVNWKNGLNDNMNGQDAKSVVVTNSNFENAKVSISAAESITFTGNTVSGAPVAITSYSATNNLKVVATGNTLDADYADQTFINAAVITAQDEFATNAVAKIGDKSYATLKAALNAVAEGETIQLLAGEYEFGNVKFPATLKNVTIKGADNKQTIIKNSKLYSADGSAVHYEGITFDGIIFDSSTILFTGARSGEVIYKNWTITNCEFKNIVATSSVSAVHFNLASDETMENFTFTNNVISNVLGSTDAILPSGLRVNYLTGDIIVTGNNISNVTNNAIQFVNVNADTLIIKDNILASNVAAIANLYNTIATETSITNNQFLIKEGQSAVGNIKNVNLSGNYWNGKAPAKLSVTNICDDYYTAVAQDGTLEGLTAYTPAVKTETHWYTSLQTAVNEADPGDIITVVNASALEEKVTAPDGYMLVETVGDNAEYTYYTLVDKTTTPTPSIGEDGYWYIGEVKTTSIAVPNVTISDDGYWVINGVKTDVVAKAVDGFNPTVTFVEVHDVKYWAIDLDGEGGEAPVNTGVKAQAFDGIGIEKIEYVSTAGNVDTYAIVFTDGFTTYFTVTNGLDGAQGPVGPQGSEGLKGEDGLKGDDGKDGNDGSEVVKTAVIISVVCVVLTLGVLGYRIFRRKSF